MLYIFLIMKVYYMNISYFFLDVKNVVVKEKFIINDRGI